jgi:hypothetical protein
VGQVLPLTVTASGQPPLFFQWRFNGTNLPGATNTSLIISNVQVCDSGIYTVVVTNELGLLRSDDAVVTVFVAPKITGEPIGQTVSSGTDVTLTVLATGNPPPRYQWRLNDVNIPGATAPTFTLTNAQPTNGGNYSVIVANVGGAIISQEATLVVTSPALLFSDNLAARGAIDTFSGLGSSSNVGATREAGETNHVGKVGGSSVWLGWVAPASGIATFDTRGSSFDTLLAIYTGTNVANLTPISSDEDRGGFLTSQAAFNATKGTEYLIVVDGFAGQTGDIVLSWKLDTNTVPFPRIITQPLSRSVLAGTSATFSVDVASSPTSLRYQWLFGCQAIAGATNASVTITNVQRANVGSYEVFVMNDSTRVAESFPASLEIGPDPKGLSQDKPEDLYLPVSLPGGVAGGAESELGASDAEAGTAFVSVALGAIGSQLFDNFGATTQPGEPIHCAAIGGSSKWFGLKPLASATMEIDTVGSDFDTVLAVYTGGTNISTFTRVACDNNGAPDGIRSLVRFPATNGTNYTVVVDGVNGAQGNIKLNWGLGIPPSVIFVPTSRPTVRGGDTYFMNVTITDGFPAPRYQWWLNGDQISGATNSSLVLNNVQLANAGTYRVMVMNVAGEITITNAVINVDAPLNVVQGPGWTNGQFKLLVTGNVGQSYTVQASTNLVDWTALKTYWLPSNIVTFTDTNAFWHSRRFYRAIPWPSLENPKQLINGQIEFQVTGGMSGQKYIIEASTDWVDWTVLLTNRVTNSPYRFIDTNAPTYQNRFYRAKRLLPQP